MTWRELFSWRPRWWVALATRLRSSSESGAAEPRHRRSSEQQAQFWAEFRAGQREADRRVLEDRKILTPCRDNGAPK